METIRKRNMQHAEESSSSLSSTTTLSTSHSETRLRQRMSASIGTGRLSGALAGTGSSTQEALMGLAAGAMFGLVSPVVGHPFDLVKTKMQSMSTYRNSSFLQSVRQIYVSEGVRGFYKGFVPPLVGSVAYRGILFSAYSGAYSFCSHYDTLNQPIPFTAGLRPSVLVGAMAAATARSVIETPLEFIKVRLMVDKSALQDAHPSSRASSNVLETSRALARSPIHSIRHMYHGFTPTLLRTMGLLCSFFVCVDYSVRYIPDVINAPLIGPFFKGGICATAAWTVAFPMESAKSVIQADASGKYKQMRFATWQVMKQLYCERGIVKGLYRGFAPGAGRSFVANGVSMLVYSAFQDALRAQD